MQRFGSSKDIDVLYAFQMVFFSSDSSVTGLKDRAGSIFPVTILCSSLMVVSSNASANFENRCEVLIFFMRLFSNFLLDKPGYSDGKSRSIDIFLRSCQLFMSQIHILRTSCTTVVTKEAPRQVLATALMLAAWIMAISCFPWLFSVAWLASSKRSTT